ncbi:MAG TPA: hypothetical protein VG604_01190 [Candidatus Saccharimonadales bacterium]|nr:hypothetical protein [Candidatus Saccharimonadales bacterium]
MSLALKTSLAKGYWNHNSGGEHAMKHIGDLDDANELLAANGQETVDRDELYDYLDHSGLIVVRQIKNRDVLDAVGVAVADKYSRPGVIDVKNILVSESHRNKGIAGFMLGKLITDSIVNTRANVSTAFYGKSLEIADQSYILPGVHVMSSAINLGDNLQKFIDSAPLHWNGIRSIDDGDITTSEVIRDGSTVATLESNGFIDAKIKGQSATYDHIAFAAIAALNT